MNPVVQRDNTVVNTSDRPKLLGVRYLGPFVTDTSVPGETKRDGIIPAHPGGGALQVARDRWVLFLSTLTPEGWDACHSILYQLRADAPDGRILQEGMIASAQEDWDPLGSGDRLVKCCGMPIAFGVPHDAVCGTQPMPSAGVFVVKWYRFAQKRHGDLLLHPSDPRQDWVDGTWIKQRTLRVEWAQFRLNKDRNDIEMLVPPSVLRQHGYEMGESLCSLGPNIQTHHGMKPPVPENVDCTSWVSCDTFIPYHDNRHDHGSVAPVRYVFNEQTDLYEWRDVGQLITLPGRVIGEASVNRVGEEYIVALRSFGYNNSGTQTVWFRTPDLFSNWGPPRFTEAPSAPRVAFSCGDGILRLFGNERVSHDQNNRSVLRCWDVDAQRLTLGRVRTIFDARQRNLPFVYPLVDMPKLCPAQGTRQLLLFRLIDRVHTANLPRIPKSNKEAFALAGIHAAELTLAGDIRPQWNFRDRSRG
ncbi:MAG: hypothetical protein IT445_19895 [Phycisphaeraceae bacterium]|nr:hypothetical protein [Phycisphaeraceae bacterium]